MAEEEKVVDIKKEGATESKPGKKPEEKKEIQLTDDESEELKDLDARLTGLRLKHSFIRGQFLTQERELVQNINSLTNNFNKELKRVYKKRKLQNVRLRDVNYEEKKLLLF